MESHFSPWYAWHKYREYSGCSWPGIYVIAIARTDLVGKVFEFSEDVVYIGMTNAVAGLRGRLSQFDSTISQKRCLHGGADRFLYKHQNYDELTRSMFVSLRHFACDPESQSPTALRVMGEVAKAEFDAMALFVERFGHLPEFNRKKESPKYSLTFGRAAKRIS